jgi:hypothetical protein
MHLGHSGFDFQWTTQCYAQEFLTTTTMRLQLHWEVGGHCLEINLQSLKFSFLRPDEVNDFYQVT